MDYCPDHTKLVNDVGEIKGAVKCLVTGQETIFEKLDALKANGAQVKADLSIEQIKTKPIFWAITIMGSVFLTALVSGIMHYLFIHFKV